MLTLCILGTKICTKYINLKNHFSRKRLRIKSTWNIGFEILISFEKLIIREREREGERERERNDR